MNGTWFRHPTTGVVWSNYTTCVVEDVGICLAIVSHMRLQCGGVLTLVYICAEPERRGHRVQDWLRHLAGRTTALARHTALFQVSRE